MKRILIFGFLLVIGLWPASSFADTAMVMANGSFDVPDIFTLEFYDREPDKYLYTTNIPFTNMDPTKTWVPGTLSSKHRPGITRVQIADPFPTINVF